MNPTLPIILAVLFLVVKFFVSIPKFYWALRRHLVIRRFDKADAQWVKAGFVQVRPGTYELHSHLTDKQLRSVSNGNMLRE